MTNNDWQKYVGIMIIYHKFIHYSISGSKRWYYIIAFHK